MLCDCSCHWHVVCKYPLLRNSVCGRSAGGVSKEFFQLLVREIFSADYGMFAFNEETREFWFSAAALEMGVSPLDFRMVGQVLGLAIFNGVLLDVHLPLVRAPLGYCVCWVLQLCVRVYARSHAYPHALRMRCARKQNEGAASDSSWRHDQGCARVQVTYKKLLNGMPTFADLQDAQPGLAKGLQALLDYAGDDVADVFSQTFEVEYRLFDTARPRLQWLLCVCT